MTRTRAPAKPVAQPAMQQLLDLAMATRPDLDRDDLHGALMVLHAAGWHWPKVLTAVAGMCARGETPHDLRAAARATSRAGTARRGAARARQALPVRKVGGQKRGG